MAILCNDISLPVSLFVFHGNYRTQVNEVYLKNTYTKSQNPINFKEELKTGFQFFIDTEEDWDEDAKIEIQTSLYNNEDTQEHIQYPLNKEPLINWVYQNKSNETFPWRMGTYMLNIIYKGVSYTTSIYVTPLYLTDQQVSIIHNYLEKKVEGLIYDLVYSSKNVKTQDEVQTNWYFDYAKYMMRHKTIVNFNLLKLENEPKTKLISAYQVKRNIGIIDKKSIRWETSSHGVSKNSSNSYPNYFFNRIKKEEYNNTVNQWMKTILFNWSGDIHNVTDFITKAQDSIKIKLSSINRKLEKLELRKDFIKLQREVARTEKVDLYVQTTTLKKDLDKYRNIYDQQHKWLDNLRSIHSRIVHLLYKSFLSEVERGKIKPLLTSSNYYLINEIFEKSKLIQKNAGDKEQFVKLYKPFWQIYEYYCLFTIIDCLNKCGFILKKDKEFDLLKSFYYNEIPSGSHFLLEKSDLVIHCWYDKYHGDKFTAELNGDLFFTAQEKKRPDIKLDLYKKQLDGSLKFQGCLIFDAKFRKFSNMHNNDYATSTYQQLTNYSLFFYLGEDRSTRPVVDKVICLYGSESKGPIKKEVFPLTYINLFPKLLDNNEIEIKGEHEVLIEINKWIGGIE
ncbi:nuclease domain-containing protein [Jeotgalibacillus campisalis]|uniref:DUF2357 domain-containing protein n=1 Tax=Jeotgalibacillus campisalis TaxID=220754 RepID=A0A0C2RDM5_9BACL|nr:nuclease domain-containing protein [Jeotgalibacillus campisalis]KIL48365.1 hypothetical protein KR50_14010 [Jeotgalibacillus campisalis]